MPRWRSAQTRRLKAPAASRPHFEELEPRVLYSADLAPTGLPGWAPSAEVRQLDTRLSDSADSAHASQQQQEVRLEIVFVDTRIDDYQRLLDNLTQQTDVNRELRVVLLDAEQDGIDTISRNLTEQPREVAAVHLISHGDPGHLQLGASLLDLNSIEARQEQLRSWALSLGSDADLLIYGCDVAATPDGQALIERLALLTGADVAASDDKTGNAEAGGDWILEYRSGTVETTLAVSAYGIAGWNSVLANYVVTSTADSGANTLRQAIIDANANAGADSITFNIAGTGSHTITLASVLPTITDAVNIDASTDDSFAANGDKPAVVLDGNNGAYSGLLLGSSAGGSTIRGLVITNFQFSGIVIESGSTGNTIAGNYIGNIGTNGTLIATGNGSTGIFVNGSNNVIGGNSPADRNVIGGNSFDGVFIGGGAGNQIIGNYIGTDASGNVANGNGEHGVYLLNAATGNLIQNNVITASTQHGVLISGEDTDGNSVLSNRIGVFANGTLSALGVERGVSLANGADNTIIGAPGAGNWIAGTSGTTIVVIGDSSGTKIQGNRIGTDLTGTLNWGPQLHGIYLGEGANTTLIGGTGAGEGNIIAFGAESLAGNDGIRIYTDAGTGNAILGNSIYGSGDALSLGIDIGSSYITANDAGDGDTGANNQQNFPVLTLARTDGASTVEVSGTLNSNASSDFRIEFFASPSEHPSGHGEGQIYLGFVNVTTNASGDATFATTLSGVAVPAGYTISATATRSNATFTTFTDTSEFARDITAISTTQGQLVVDTASDTTDGDTTSLSTLLANKGADGFISLREAIIAANNTANGATPDQINFNIAGAGVHTITLTSALPTLTSGVIIDATTDDSFAANGSRPAVILNAGGFNYGLSLIDADNSTIRGLAIRNFGIGGIVIDANTSGTTIAGNYIGRVGSDGNYAATGGTGTYGIGVSGSNNVIGGNGTADGNVIAVGNYGIFVNGISATGNQIIGNHVGVNATGTALMTGSGEGIALWTNSSGNTVKDNMIATDQSGRNGIQDVGAGNNIIQGNRIGTDTTGTATWGVNQYGIRINSSGNLIGGTGAGQGNVVAYSNKDGSTYDGIAVSAGTSNVILGNAIYGTNAGTSGLGIDLGASGVTANDAGDGDAGANNLQNFPVLSWASSNGADTVTVAGSLNSTANSYFRIEFFANPTADASGYGEGQIYLGYANVATDGSGNASFTTALSATVPVGYVVSATATKSNAAYNTFTDTSEFAQSKTLLTDAEGVVVVTTASDTLDGDTTSLSTLLANKGADGFISLREAIIAANNTANGATPDQINFNIAGAGTHTITLAYDGPDPGNATDLLPSITDAVIINASTDDSFAANGNKPAIALIGGGTLSNGFTLTAGSDGSTVRGLLMSGFTTSAISLSSNGNLVAGNYIGALTATGAIGGTGNYNGINISGNNNTIGGATAADRNVISGNTNRGISFEGSTPTGNRVIGNYIGTVDATGAVGTPATVAGIVVAAGNNSQIGGTGAGEGNLVAGLSGFGVSVISGTGHAVLGNSIHSNSNLGLNVGANGVTPNDAGDADTGANNLQNFPVLTLATTDGSNITVAGTFNSTANSYFHIEFFANPTADGSGYGEGQIYLGFVNVATDGSGNASFSTTLSAAVPAGYAISATATKSDASYSTFTDTSEFALTLLASQANSAPIITSNGGGATAAINVAENTTSITTVTATDTDLPAQTLTFSIVGGADQGKFSIDSNTGLLTFGTTPNFELPGDVGGNNVYDVTVQVSDGNGGTDSQAISVTVTNVNEVPTVANAIPNQNATEDAAFNFQFAANIFNDVDVGDTLTYSALLSGGGALPAWLSFDSATRSFSGTPANGDVGTLSIDVIADDGHGGTVSDTFDIVVANSNDAPTVANAIPDQNATENIPLNFTFAVNTFNDQDVGDTLTYSTQLNGGGALPAWLSFDGATRTFSGTPSNADVGTITLDVIADDGHGGTVTDTFSITVGNTNDAPYVANPIPNQNATEDAAYNFQFAANTFADPDVGDTLTYTTSLLPAWLSFNDATRTFSGTPANSDVGTISITVTATDGTGQTINDTFDLVVANTNDAPSVANAIPNQNATEDVAFNFTFAVNTFNDSDVGDTLTYSAQLAGGGALPVWLSFDSATRTFSGTPLNANVGTLNIDVIANDGHGGSVTNTFTLTVGNSNDAPTVANPIPNQNATEDAAFNFQFAANAFNDIDVGDTLTYSAQLNGGGALPGWLSFDSATRTFSGTPANADVGTLSIDVIANDGNGGSVTDTFDIVVANSNDAPTVANAIPNQNATEDTAFNFQFAANTFNDIDVDDTLTYSAQLNGGGALPGWLSFDSATRTFSGTPANADVGTLSIDVIADDGNGGSVTDTFDIVVANSNDAPSVANAIPNQTATEDVAFNFTFAVNTFNDSDVGDTLTYSAQLAGGGALPVWLSFDSATRTFSGTPLNANVGTVSIDVIANDGHGGSVTDTFTLTVGNSNDAPTVANPIPNQTATEDAAFNFQFAANTFNDVDVGDTLTYSAQLNGGGALPAWLSFDSVTRTFSGTPLNADVGTVSIDVIANDGNGGTGTDTFNITVGNSNNAPTVVNDIPNQTATEDAAFNFQFAANAFGDVDVGDVLTYTTSALPTWLSFDSATRTFSGTPANGDVGVISIDVTANDGHGGTVTDSFSITVSNTNDAPTLANPIPNQNATANTAFNFTFAANTFNDSDVGDTLTYSVSGLPAWLNFDANTRTFSGTPGNADVGSISVTVTATDGAGQTSSDAFDIVVGNTINNAPTLANPIPDQNAAEDNSFNYTFPVNTFADPDIGDTLTYSASGLPAWLSFDAGTRTFTGTPTNADVGSVSVSVTATDSSGLTASDTFNIVVGNVNDAPTATPVTLAEMAEDSGPRLITQAELLSQAVDADGDTLVAGDLSIVNGGGSLIDNLDGTWSYTPAANDDSSVTFSYRISDAAQSVTTSASLDLTPVNDSPTGLPIISGSALESQILSVLTNGISDADGLGAFSYQWRANGVVISGADAATLTLNSTLVGKTITVVVSYQDGNGAQENLSSAAIGPVAALPVTPETPTPPTLPPAPDTPTPPTTPAPDESGGEDGETPTSPPPSPPPSPQPDPETDAGSAPDDTGLTGNPNLSGGSGLGAPLPFLVVQVNVQGVSPLNLIGHTQTLVQPIRREDVATLLPIPENQLSFGMMTLQTTELSSSRLDEFSLRRLEDEEVNRNEAEVDLTTRTLQIGGLALSTLAAAWAVRMSGIMASLMISMPIWRNIDPLPILHQQNKARRDWLEDLPEEKDFHTRSDAEDIPSQAEGNRI
jgi:hypothetical protein